MRMRAGIYRVLRIALIGAVAWLVWRWLQPMGLGWLVLAIAGAGAGGWILFRVWRVKQAQRLDARADGWAEALVDPSRRPEAIEELRAERAEHLGRAPEDHARLTLVLAELLEADGDAAGAVEVLGEVGPSGLDPALAAIVQHALAVAHLSDGDVAAARATLEDRDRSGDPKLELRCRMLLGLIEAEDGHHAEAKRIASESKEEALDDEDLRIEARVLEAVAFDAAGDRDEALARMARLGDEMLEVLTVLGLPRVRRLADEALAERDPG